MITITDKISPYKTNENMFIFVFFCQEVVKWLPNQD